MFAKRPTVDGPLDAVNDVFHDHYDRMRRDEASSGPVFVVLADSLVVFRGSGHRDREQLRLSPRLFHVIKSVAHAPLALHAIVSPAGDGPVDGSMQSRLEALRRHVVDSLASLPDDTARDVADDLREVLEASRAFVERSLALARVTRDDLETFARATGPLLLRLTDHATRIQLAALDEAVTTALAKMSSDDRRRLEVVVTGDHQARARSLGMQYFRKRLREPEGVEDRVAYAEGVTDEGDALALVGTRRVDRGVARAFFGDEKRLQRDVLGDSVREILGKTDLAPID